MQTKLLVFFVLAVPLLARGGDKLTLAWTDLSAWTQPEAEARIQMATGEKLQGRIVEVQAESLSLAVKNATRSVDKAQVRGMELRRNTGRAAKQGMVAGLVVGAALMAVGSAFGDRPSGQGTAVRIVGPMAGIGMFGAIGYAWGGSSERAWNRVEFK